MVTGGRERPQIEASLLSWPSLSHHYFEPFEFCYCDLHPAGQEGVWEQEPGVFFIVAVCQMFWFDSIFLNPKLIAITPSYPR